MPSKLSQQIAAIRLLEAAPVVAKAIAAGASLNEAARAAGVSTSTLRAALPRADGGTRQRPPTAEQSAFTRAVRAARKRRRTVSAEQLAGLLGEHPRTVQHWCKRGQIPASKPAGTRAWRVDIEALCERWGDTFELDRAALLALATAA